MEKQTKKGIITPCSARQIKEGGSKSSVGREWVLYNRERL